MATPACSCGFLFFLAKVSSDFFCSLFAAVVQNLLKLDQLLLASVLIAILVHYEVIQESEEWTSYNVDVRLLLLQTLLCMS